MKHRISPGVVGFVIVIVCSTVLVSYWRGLVYEGKKKEKKGKMGGGKMPPPSLLGLPTLAVTTLAGDGEGGLRDGRGAAARFDGPNAVALGPDGTVYVADARNHRLRRVTPAGEVSTLAGSSPPTIIVGGFQDGPAATARLSNPSGVAAAPDGMLYFSDTGNHRVRLVRQGVVSTLAGGDTPPDEAGIPTGGFQDGAGAAARFRFPTGLCRAADGSLLVVDTGNRKLRRVTPQGIVSTVADLGAAGAVAPFAVTLGPAGAIYVTDPGSVRVLQVTGATVTAVAGFAATPFWRLPTGIAVGDQLYLADAGAHCLVAKGPGPQVLLAGVVPPDVPSAGFTDGPGDAARFASPSGMVIAPDRRTMYVADYGNNAIRVVKVR